MSPCMCSGDELIISNILQLYRYLVWLEVFLTNIDRSHPGAKELLQKGGIAVCVTKKYYIFRWVHRSLLNAWCLPAMVSYYVNPGSIL